MCSLPSYFCFRVISASAGSTTFYVSAILGSSIQRYGRYLAIRYKWTLYLLQGCHWIPSDRGSFLDLSTMFRSVSLWSNIALLVILVASSFMKWWLEIHVYKAWFFFSENISSGKMGVALWKFTLAASSLFLLVAAQSSDICGEINGVLRLPSSRPPYKQVEYGNIGRSIYRCSRCIFFTGKPSQMIVFASRISPAMLEAQQLPTQRWPVQEEIPFQ